MRARAEGSCSEVHILHHHCPVPYQSAAAKDPAKAEEAKKLLDLKQSLFQGDALRSMLLTAYAFGTIGMIAQIASVVAFVGGAVLLLLALLGFNHSRKVAAS